jgi:hypothetical protein
MRMVVLALLIAASLAACSGISIGPVDHSCGTNPGYSEGSGCGHGHHA